MLCYMQCSATCSATNSPPAAPHGMQTTLPINYPPKLAIERTHPRIPLHPGCYTLYTLYILNKRYSSLLPVPWPAPLSIPPKSMVIWMPCFMTGMT